MTRFLARTLAGVEGGSVNDETERLFAYHQATKHTYYSVRAAAHFLDWRNQPDPFRIYHGSKAIALPAPAAALPAAQTFATIAALDPADTARQNSVPPDMAAHSLEGLSTLHWHSMAISAWKQVPQTETRYSLRVNPSSGNLHPTETHLAVRGFSGVADGLYHYRVDRHELEQRGEGGWVRHLAGAFGRPEAADARLLVVLTSILWREAWKYRERAYRYCCHDLGHAAMSLLLAGRAMGLSGAVAGHFCDSRVSREMGLEHSDEAPMALLVFRDASRAQSIVEAEGDRPGVLTGGIANELSEEEEPYYLMLGVHRSTVLAEDAGPVPATGGRASAHPEARLPGAQKDAPLGETVRRRRSALDFDPATTLMKREEFQQILDSATRDWAADWRGNFDGRGKQVPRGRDFIDLYVYVHRVEGMEPGVYRWNPEARRAELLHAGNVQRVAAFVSLEQQLAGNACFAISMIADLAEAARIFGNRGYRYVHFEAGAIGQRLYLGAEALRWNATGIGAFYDDDVHRYLGFLKSAPDAQSAFAAEQRALVVLEADAGGRFPQQSKNSVAVREENDEGASTALPRQVIYHFAVGRAVPDPRLDARA